MLWQKNLHGDIKNKVPLMVVEKCKGDQVKVRPVLDFCRLKQCIKSAPGDATPLCQNRMRVE